MIFQGTAAVVLAGGYGQLIDGRSKLDYNLGGVPMIVRVVWQVMLAGWFEEIALIVNPLFGQALKETLANHLTAHQMSRLTFYEQPKRDGPAGAVACALPFLPGQITDLFVTFGDMPLWRPKTIRSLVDHHLSEDSTVSLAILEVPEDDPAHKFGRIVMNETGFARIIEPGYGDLSVAPPVNGKVKVNPSLYVFKRWFLNQNVPLLEPHDKGDGFPPELWLPDLIKMAHDQMKEDLSIKLAHIDLEDPQEARGVNTLKELEVAEQIFAEMR